MSGTDTAHRAICLRACYAMPQEYGGEVSSAIGLRACYGVSGTDVGGRHLRGFCLGFYDPAALEAIKAYGG
eukprot:2204291-Rhodomonas_salina.1